MEPGRAYRLDADGVRVHAVDWQPTGDAGPFCSPVVLLIHGLGANTLSWAPFGQPLADALGTSVTAIDLIGFGRTRAPERRATLAAQRALVADVLRQLGPAIVIGNSMGAVIGAGVAARHPELVEALLLVNPALPWQRILRGDWWRLVRLAPLMMPSLGRHAVAARARLLGPARVVDASLALSLRDPACIDPELRRRLVLLTAERYAYPEAPAAYADAARSLLSELGRGAFDRDLTVATRARPTMLVHGAEDRLVAAELARAAAERHPALSFEMLDGIGHAPQLEVPERLVEVTARWLEGALRREVRHGPADRPNGRMGPWRQAPVGATGEAVSSASRSAPSSAS